jgi:hypothetical protein
MAAAILVEILTTKPLIFIKLWEGGSAASRWMGVHEQGWVAQLVNLCELTNLLLVFLPSIDDICASAFNFKESYISYLV